MDGDLLAGLVGAGLGALSVGGISLLLYFESRGRRTAEVAVVTAESSRAKFAEASERFEAGQRTAEARVVATDAHVKELEDEIDALYNDLPACDDPRVARDRLRRVLERSRARAGLPRPAAGAATVRPAGAADSTGAGGA